MLGTWLHLPEPPFPRLRNRYADISLTGGRSIHPKPHLWRTDRAGSTRDRAGVRGAKHAPGVQNLRGYPKISVPRINNVLMQPFKKT